jgi:glycosyltransferase involved in cell wall biosynthesis
MGKPNKMAFHILYLSYDGLTDALGQSQILAYQKHIASEVCLVTIISFEKKEAYAKLGDKTAQICKEAGINWQPFFYTKTPPVLSTAYDLYRAWRRIKEIEKIIHIDIVHCRGYISALLGEKVKKAFGSKFIFDMRGWWPDEKKESGFWSGRLYQPIYNYFKKKENDFFLNSDITVSLTEIGKQHILATNLKKEHSIKVISTCTDLSLFNIATDDKIENVKTDLGFPLDSKVLVYSGALGGNYPIEAIFLFINTFLSISDKHYCLILSKDKLEKTIQLPAKTILKSVSYNEVALYLSACNLGFIYYKKAFSNIGRCPTKLGEYWACGLPAISPAEVGDMEEIFEKYPTTGITVPNWIEEEIKNSLNQVLAFPLNKTALRNAAIDYFALEKGVAFYKNLYTELLQ